MRIARLPTVVTRSDKFEQVSRFSHQMALVGGYLYSVVHVQRVPVW